MIDIIVIGGGAAGMTAALYAKRSGKSVKIFEKESFGGQIANSPKVENFPSIKAISGTEFSDNLFDQIMDLGCDFELDTITGINKENNIFYINGMFSNYEAKSVIIATGLEHRKINIGWETLGKLQICLPFLSPLSKVQPKKAYSYSSHHFKLPNGPFQA